MQRVCGTDGAIRSHQAGLEGPFLVLPTGGIRRQDPYPSSPRNGSLPPRLALWENDFLPQQQQQRKNINAVDSDIHSPALSVAQDMDSQCSHQEKGKDRAVRERA